MNKSTLLLIVILFSLLCYVCCLHDEQLHNDSEHYYNTVTQKESNPLTSDIMSDKMEILMDPVFSNVIVFNNDLNPYVKGEQIGLAKCLAECNGNCVEFGITGTATCFPK